MPLNTTKSPPKKHPPQSDERKIAEISHNTTITATFGEFISLFSIHTEQIERKNDLFKIGNPSILSYGRQTTRKPLLLLRFDGVLLLRFDTRQFLALLFQLPPRKTRLLLLTTYRISSTYLCSQFASISFIYKC